MGFADQRTENLENTASHRSGVGVEDKQDESPVTIADRKAEAAMRGILGEAFPDHSVFGEEEGLDLRGGDSGYLWVLDPIDGTRSFITGLPPPRCTHRVSWRLRRSWDTAVKGV